MLRQRYAAAACRDDTPLRAMLLPYAMPPAYDMPLIRRYDVVAAAAMLMLPAAYAFTLFSLICRFAMPCYVECVAIHIYMLLLPCYATISPFSIHTLAYYAALRQIIA